MDAISKGKLHADKRGGRPNGVALFLQTHLKRGQNTGRGANDMISMKIVRCVKQNICFT